RAPGDRDQRALKLELGRKTAAALQGEVEPGEVDDRAAELIGGEVARLAECLLGGKGVHLQPGRGVAGADALLLERLAGADAADVRGEPADEHVRLARTGRAFEDRLA